MAEFMCISVASHCRVISLQDVQPFLIRRRHDKRTFLFYSTLHLFVISGDLFTHGTGGSK